MFTHAIIQRAQMVFALRARPVMDSEKHLFPGYQLGGCFVCV